MQQKISKERIKKKLEYLHSRLPKPPTAVQDLYLLPKHFAEEVLDTNFSRQSLQKISDHIGYFLGLLRSVKINFIEEPTDSEWIGAGNGTIVSDKNGSSISGLYKVIGVDHSEILIIKKQRYQLEHILAILAHESTHNYLYHHGVSESEETENEILTDVAAAYLGLGVLLLDGYQPISWTSSHWTTFTASGYTTHTISIGYLKPKNIRYAIARAAELRHLKKLASPLPLFDRITVAFHFGKIRGRKEKKKQQIKSLSEKLDKAKSLYGQSFTMMQKASKNTSKMKISPKDAHTLVEISNAFWLGEVKLAIERLSMNINILKNSAESEDADFSSLLFQVSELLKTTSYWHEVLSKYVE